MAILRINITEKEFYFKDGRKVHYDLDPITSEKLIDPYYAESIKYRDMYYDMMDKTDLARQSGEQVIDIDLMPQPGPQWLFLRNSSDLIIYGGSAGAGKTYAITLEGLRNLDKKQHTSVVFRRKKEQLSKPGGPWAEGVAMYSQIPGAIIKESAKEFHFPLKDKNGVDIKNGIGPIIKYDGMEYSNDKLGHQGRRIIAP